MEPPDASPLVSQQELADLAQVDVAFVGRLVELGILDGTDDSFDATRVWRVRVLRAVEAAGVSMEAVATATLKQDFDLTFLDSLLPPPPPLSGRRFRDLIAGLGDQGALATTLAETLGLGLTPDLQMLASDDAMITAFIDQWGADPDIALRAARLVGQTSQRFAEGWAGLHYELYRSQLGPDRTVWAPDAQAQEGVAARSALELANTMLPWMVLHHVERLLAVDLADNVLTSTGPFAERSQDPDAGARLPAIAFVDLSGYTALTEASGNEAAARATSRLEHAVILATTANSGRGIKLLGDGALLMFHGADASAAALRAVIAVRDELLGDGLHPHAGIDLGPVTERDGDIFGRTVNRASRLAAQATEGQVVVSDTVAAALGTGADALDLEPIGELELKGIDQPVRAFRVR